MDAELKTKWLAALRSGEFKQGQGKLHDPATEAYCCLGVLCKIMGAEFRQAEGANDDGDYYSLDHVPVLDGQVLSSADDEELSPRIEKQLGIDQKTLVILNDGHGREDDPNYAKPVGFSEIADFIEKNY